MAICHAPGRSSLSRLGFLASTRSAEIALAHVLRAGVAGRNSAVEVGGAETFVDTGRQGRINIAVGVSGTSVAKFPVRGDSSGALAESA